MFEMFTLVSEIHDNIGLVLGMKNMHELEGEISTRRSEFRFLNRSLPIYVTQQVTLQSQSQKLIKCEVPFTEPLSGNLIIKLMIATHVKTFKAKIINNQMTIRCINDCDTPFTLDPQTPIGIADIRSMGYYSITYNAMENTFKGSHEFQDVRTICDEYNRMLQKAQKADKDAQARTKDKYPWLEKDDRRRIMTDEEIIENYVDLSKSDLNTKDRENLFLKLLKKYKQAFSLRDEIGECPNIQIDMK